jgi:hypothetical protein
MEVSIGYKDCDWRGCRGNGPGSVPITYEEIAELIASDFRSPENRALPVGWVLLAELAIHRGDTTRELVLPALHKRLLFIMSAHPPIDFSPIPNIRSVSKQP